MVSLADSIVAKGGPRGTLSDSSCILAGFLVSRKGAGIVLVVGFVGVLR